MLARLKPELRSERPLIRRVRGAASRMGLRLGLRAWRRVVSAPISRLYHYDLIFRTGNFRSLTWLGVPIWQNQVDLWTIQETISEIRPGLLIETGTDFGGSARFYGDLMTLLGFGRVITIDIAEPDELDHPLVEFLHGSSTDPEILAKVREAVDETDGPVMVILDGNHSEAHVAEELELYGPLVTPGSVLLSQDGIIDQMRLFRDSRPGPLGANAAFLERHPEFEFDAERNGRFGLTQHPLGWMRRRPT